MTDEPTTPKYTTPPQEKISLGDRIRRWRTRQLHETWRKSILKHEDKLRAEAQKNRELCLSNIYTYHAQAPLYKDDGTEYEHDDFATMTTEELETLHENILQALRKGLPED